VEVNTFISEIESSSDLVELFETEEDESLLELSSQ
jgi:hypothetical protein